MLVPPAGAAFIVKWPSDSHNSQKRVGPGPPLFILARTRYSTQLADVPALIILSPQADGDRGIPRANQRIKDRSTTPLDAHNPGIRTKSWADEKRILSQTKNHLYPPCDSKIRYVLKSIRLKKQ